MAAIASSVDTGDRVKAETLGHGAVRKRFRIPGEKFCEVCGDKALAHHFGALACESCKAFFRRNALRRSEVKPCSVESCCQIDKNTRRCCPSCRLAKCFDVGMKPELIYDEHQKKDLMEKVKKTRLERQSQQLSAYSECMEDDPSVVSSSAGSHHVPETITSMEVEGNDGCCSPQKFVDSSTSEEYFVDTDSILVRSYEKAGDSGISEISGLPRLEQLSVDSGELCDIESDSQQSHVALSQKEIEDTSTHQKNPPAVSQPTELPEEAESSSSLTSSEVPDLVEQVEPPVIDLRTLTRDELPSDPQMYWRFLEEERMLLTLLSAAYEDTVLASLWSRQSSLKLNMSNYSVSDFLTDCEEQVRHAVDFVKRLEDFQKLDLEDRIACFKASVGPVMSVRNSYICVAERNSFLMVKGEMSFDLCKSLFPCSPYLKWSFEQCRKLKSVAKNDITIYALLHCIILFNPGNERISNRQVVSTIRDKYVILLRHYIEATFSYLYSEDYIRELQNMIVEMRELNRAKRKHASALNCQASEEFVPFELLSELHSKDN